MITRSGWSHETEGAQVRRDRVQRRCRALWWLVLLMSAALVVPGCGGCSDDPFDEEQKAAAKDKLDPKKREKPKPDFEPPKLRVVPQKDDVAAVRPVKPGHWTAAVEEMKANNFDFPGGQLYAEVRKSGSGSVLDLERTPHRLAVVRPASLPKGQTKFLELMFLVPGSPRTAWLATELRSRGGNPVTSPGPEPLTILRAHQYNLVVLAGEGDRYRRLESMDSVRAPHADGALNYYQVVAPQLKKPLPLPSGSLAWTSIAYLIWDDVDPQLLSVEQQQALVDWLHWGGQLIISGPKSLDQLRDKEFLGSYLPALPGEPMKISADMFGPLNKRWTLPERGQPGRPLAPVNPWSGVTLKPQGDARFMPHTADLVVERQVGRGRIVVTAFRLTQREFWNWPGCDGFWNACLLHRPSRQFSQSPDLGGLKVDFADDSTQTLNPGLVTQVRYLSRDWKNKEGFDLELKPPSASESTETSPFPYGNTWQTGSADYFDSTDPFGLYDERPIGPGVAGWTDFSDVAGAARDSLREAAGIVIPKAGFVIGVLILYLIVLVPLNWLAFWGLGRVEWAWIAAPIIAIGGMAAVVKLAQLDIGFARSQTEVAVLETYHGYPRGHLTRYTALYTSLSTSYDLESDDLNTVSLPFSVDPNFTPLTGQTSATVTYQPEPNVKLSDFAVASNSTAMLHTEQMLDLGGAIEYSAQADTASLYNRTNFNLSRAGILRRKPNGQVQIAWIGDLPAGPRGRKATFLRPAALASIVPKWTFTPGDPADDSDVDGAQGPLFSLNRLADLVKKDTTLRPGEARLIALVEEPLPGITVDPAASQSGRGATLVVAHLEQPPLGDPRPDANCRRDIVTGREERELPDDILTDDAELPDA